MSVESWGITCMEALLHGVPVILLTDKSGRHSSEIIPAESWHFKMMNKNCKPEKLTEAIKEFQKLNYKDRLVISQATKNKHSKEKWIEKWYQIKEKRYESH
jgi:UDP:flavonoid glycosyltransferase YjiC (YdhE family)